MLKYAGVELTIPTQEIVSWVADNITLAECVEYERASWPGSRLPDVPFPGGVPARPAELGRLWWPWGSDRFAVGHFLASSSQLTRIRDVVYAGSGGYNPAPLLMTWDDAAALDAEVARIEPQLWMLPPRPLAQIAGLAAPYEQLYLLTLVDERFWWRFKDASFGLREIDGATWSQVFTALGSALGIPLGANGIGRPPEEYLRSHGRATLLLDAAARNCGLRFVRGLDGTVSLQTPSTAAANRNAGVNLASALAPRAGGLIGLDVTAPPHDLPPALPRTVRVTFPTGCDCHDDARASVDIDPSSLGVPETSGAATSPEIKTFHDTLVYCLATVAEANALAFSIARDYVRWQVTGTLDRAYWGVVPWPLEGAHDLVWGYLPWDVSTRVTRGPWGELNDVLQHAGTVFTGAKCLEWVRLKAPLLRDDPCNESYPAYLRRRVDNCTWDETYLEIYALPLYPEQAPIFGRTYEAICRGVHADGRWIYSLRGEDAFPGKILSGGGPSYQVLERRYLGGGQFEDLPGGARPRTVTAWEANGGAGIPAGTHVWVHVQPEDESYPVFGYVFWQASSLTVTGCEGPCGGESVSVTPTTEIEFDCETGLIVEELSDGHAFVKFGGIQIYDGDQFLCCAYQVSFEDTSCVRLDVECADGFAQVTAETTGAAGNIHLYRYQCVGGYLKEFRRTMIFICGQYYGTTAEMFVGYQGCCECPPAYYWWCWCPIDYGGGSSGSMGSSGSGSGSGSGGTPDLCCPNLTTSSTLYLTNSCGTIILTWAGDGWYGSQEGCMFFCGSGTTYWRFRCTSPELGCGGYGLEWSCDQVNWVPCPCAISVETGLCDCTCDPPFFNHGTCGIVTG